MGKGDVGRRGARIIKLVVELDVVARALQCEKRGPQLGRLRAQTAHGERTKQKRPTAAPWATAGPVQNMPHAAQVHACKRAG